MAVPELQPPRVHCRRRTGVERLGRAATATAADPLLLWSAPVTSGWIVLGVACLASLLVYFLIWEYFGAAVIISILAFGVWAILVAAEGLHGYPRADRMDPMDERRDPPEGAA